MWRIIQRINLAIFILLVFTLVFLIRSNRENEQTRNKQEHHDARLLNDRVEELEQELR